MKPTFIRFHLEHNDESEITCLFCGYPRCEQSFPCSGGGRMNIYGVHTECAEKHMAKLTQTKQS